MYMANQNTRFILNTFYPENRTVYEIMQKIIVEPDRLQMTILYGACALRTEYLKLQTHCKYTILAAFPLQHW